MAERAANGAAYDALIIGGGHNGLTCSAYLAAAGLRVAVLERRSVVGGAAVTEEFQRVMRKLGQKVVAVFEERGLLQPGA